VWQTGDPLIPGPFGDGVDFHLLSVSEAPGAWSFIYMPCAHDPGLSIDSIRVDRLAPGTQPLASVVEGIRGRYVGFARPRPLAFSLVESAPADVLFGLGFEGHPLLGAHQSWVRYRRTASEDVVVQVIRKLDPLDDDETAARIRFLKDATATGKRTPPVYHDDAVRAQRASAELIALSDTMLRERRMTTSSEALAQLLARASPLDASFQWWNLARLMGRSVLANGEVDRFAAIVRHLALAIVGLNDMQGEAVPQGMLFDAAMVLGEILSYLGTFEDTTPLVRAARLMDEAARHWRGRDAARALEAEVLGTLVGAIADGSGQALLARRFDAPPGPQLDQPGRIEAAVDVLMSFSARATHVGRRGTPALYRSASLAADLAQVLWERRIERSDRIGTEALARLSQINDAQVQTQMLLHGVRQEDLDTVVRLMPAVFGQRTTQRASLVFLRSLASARRHRLDNRFPWRDQVPIPGVRDALAGVSIESALNLALAHSFAAATIGGPADVFGMGRGSVVNAGDVVGAAWRQFAAIAIGHSDIIMVLVGESNGLLWELSEIVRQRACEKMVLVVAPAEAGDSPPPAALPLLRQAGYGLPDSALEPGFLFFDSDGALASRMPFESLWDGTLHQQLVARVAAALARSS